MIRASLSWIMFLALEFGVVSWIAAGLDAGEERPIRLVCFGDSITEGYKITEAFTTPYPDMLQGLLDEKKGKGAWLVVNAGISGQDSRQGLARVDKVLKEHGPDWMLILYGTNDLWSGRNMNPEDTDKNLRAIVAGAKAGKVNCVIGTIAPVWDFDAKVSRVNEVIRKIALDEEIVLADLNAGFEKAIEAAGGRADKAAWEKYYQVEEGGFVHPNDAGNRLIAGEWLEALDKALTPK